MMASKKQPNSNAANSKGKSLAITSTAEDFASYASRRATVDNRALPLYDGQLLQMFTNMKEQQAQANKCGRR